MRGRILVILALLVAAASALTWSPAPQKDDVPILTSAQIDPGLLATLKRSCGDCHSDHTRSPWYSYVAPVSFLIRRDVHEVWAAS